MKGLVKAFLVATLGIALLAFGMFKVFLFLEPLTVFNVGMMVVGAAVCCLSFYLVMRSAEKVKRQ